jgi:hypothetical protein
MPNITFYLQDSLYQQWLDAGKEGQAGIRQKFQLWLLEQFCHAPAQPEAKEVQA